MEKGMKLYYDYTLSPIGKLYYQTVFSQLSGVQDKNILDFGSGFGFVSDYLALKNRVTAIEPDSNIIKFAINENSYIQINASADYLKTFSDESFDFICCHLVLEFADNREQVLNHLIRLLKQDGRISIIHHNRAGRLIQAVVQEFDLDEARRMFDNKPSFSSAFGDINYYTKEDILNLSNNSLEIEQIYGVRALASLHDGLRQSEENWLSKMQKVEDKLTLDPDFIKISYFNHLILKKKLSNG